MKMKTEEWLEKNYNEVEYIEETGGYYTFIVDSEEDARKLEIRLTKEVEFIIIFNIFIDCGVIEKSRYAGIEVRLGRGYFGGEYWAYTCEEYEDLNTYLEKLQDKNETKDKIRDLAGIDIFD